MGFYTSPSFFAALALAIIPAAVLGFLEKPLKKYGFCVSCLFLLALFSADWRGFAAFMGFLALTGACTYAVLRSWKSGKQNVLLYRVCLALCLLPLVICKVEAVFQYNLIGFFGISYLTFKALQVIIEIRDGLIEDLNWFDWLYFITFFAVITSGPIDRSRRFEQDANARYTRSEYLDLLSRGILLLLAGAVYQLVLASIFQAQFTPRAYNPAKSLVFNYASAVKDAYFYGLFLFFDFAGYSLMAMGASYCFGIRTPRNFRAPFAALDMKDFWNRWHMTLSFWLRDFVFMRFSTFALKRKLFSDRLYTACCGYLINMTLMGVWHGLTPDYLVYGLYHGILLAATDAFQKRSKFYKKHKYDWWFKGVSWAITFNLVIISFAIFSGQASLFIGGYFG